MYLWQSEWPRWQEWRVIDFIIVGDQTGVETWLLESRVIKRKNTWKCDVDADYDCDLYDDRHDHVMLAIVVVVNTRLKSCHITRKGNNVSSLGVLILHACIS